MDSSTIWVIIPALAIIGGIVAKILRGPIGDALAHRLGGGAAGSPELRAELEALHQEVQSMRQELSETQERLDFAERLLSKGRDTERTPQ